MREEPEPNSNLLVTQFLALAVLKVWQASDNQK